MKNQTHENVIKILTNEIFLKYGFPNVIITDNSRNFKNNSFQTYLEKLNIKVVKGTLFYSQSNKICERSLRTIQSSIHKLVKMTEQEWDTYLPFIAYNYNTSYIESLQSRPFELMYYRKPPSCLDIFLKKFYTTLPETNSTHYEIIEKANMARQIASENQN
ncbi:Integrase, catalytic core domain and Ribonuclease H-like domain-containing protein [Strongyloides ratti]|uniref:Integrase, catalytic core domain and Ribonuclease H-like domain-containing protein n=1 Tax=Strongyloides ratti TaxID=34506 RepID=A0A090KW49_STRRB|nr:Integrase, catalytic core domain and Ribonuclease H-like domain-containing protein [Strongyloides ratti]CEF61646.1 Integrase, catalytic core domain and Ribonuclease H-like domain-containing protein [Strongyloides ratti]